MIYFLDDHGTRHAGAISEKYPEIRDTRTAGAARFSEFAIQHAGFVVLREVPSGLTVSWSPSIISNSGLAALLYAVSDMDHVPLILRSWRGSQWTTEVLSAQPEQRMARIIEIHATDCRQFSEFISTRQLSSDALKVDESFHDLVSYWRAWQSQSRRDLDDDDLGKIGELSSNRFVLVVREPHLPRELSVAHVGNGFPEHIQSALDKTLHRSICDMPDYHYGQSVAQAFERTIQNPRVPLYELIDANVRYRGFERERRIYKRLILRFASPGYEDFLISATVPSDAEYWRAVG